MKLQEYVDNVRKYVPASKGLEATVVIDSINYARLELGRFFDFDVSIETFVGDGSTQEFDLPSGVQKVLACFGLYGNVRYPISRIPMKEYMWENMVSLPAYYWINHRMETSGYKNLIGFYPIVMTGCSVEVKCSYAVSPLSNMNDDDIIPFLFFDIISTLAASDVAFKAGNPGLGNLYMNLYRVKRQQVVATML